MNNTQFTVEIKLSESTTTSVYRAFDSVLHRRVLLKVLHKHLATDGDIRSRFIREARACAALRSEHIVQVYDLTESDGSPAIVMEFVEGKSLKEIIAGSSANTFPFARKTAVHVLRALSTAHKNGIIHRDIKPGNILVSESGTVKVTDFGLASFAMSPTVTMDGMVLGTPAYMAPEQVRGEEIDGRSDLFSLGATLVEVLSGERLFEGSTYSECMKKVLAFREPDLEKFISGSSPEFVDFLKKLMASKRSERFASAQEALASLGEKKSEIFLHPVPRRFVPSKKVVRGIAVMALIVFPMLFLWLKSSDQSSGESIKGSNADSIGKISFEKQYPPPTQNEKQMPLTGTSDISAAVLKENAKTETKKFDSGKVYISSTPWAKVFVNNTLIGETPMAKPVVLAAGSHSIMFTNPAFDPIVTTVTVEGNKEITVTGDFFSHAGFVVCSAIPWAEIFIDEQSKGITPLKPILVSAGKHRLRFKNPAYADIVREITVAAQDTVQLSISFNQ